MECRGGPGYVVSQGRIVFEEGKLQVQRGTGRFISRKPFPDIAYQRIKYRNKVWLFFDSFTDLHSVSVSFVACIKLVVYIHYHSKFWVQYDFLMFLKEGSARLHLSVQ